MTLAADILAACSKPCRRDDIIRATGVKSIEVEPMLASLVRGCYLVSDCGKYRLTTAQERAAWFASEPAA